MSDDLPAYEPADEGRADDHPSPHGDSPADRAGGGPATPLPDSGAGSLAPVWARGIARVVDLFIVFSAASMVLNLTGVVEVVDDEVVTSNPFVALLVLVGVWGFYEVGGTLGQNRMVGKLLMGLRVRSVEADRAPAPSRVITRWLLPSVVVLVPLGSLQFVLVAVVYLSALLNPRFQGLHDRAAHTLVVRSR